MTKLRTAKRQDQATIAPVVSGVLGGHGVCLDKYGKSPDTPTIQPHTPPTDAEIRKKLQDCMLLANIHKLGLGVLDHLQNFNKCSYYATGKEVPYELKRWE